MSEIRGTSGLWADFESICDCGGRFSGSPGEAQAVELLKVLGAQASGSEVCAQSVPFRCWRSLGADLRAPDQSLHVVNPLVGTVATPFEGIVGEVVDVGRGTPEEFDAHRTELAGRIAMVRHELMFAPGTIHRRKKYTAAFEAGAIGFLVVGPATGSMVSGSSGRQGEIGIPAVGISPETAACIKRSPTGWPTVRLRIETEEADATAENLFFDIPGREQGLVVLSAHIDGHDLGESAIDNASGLVVALEVARRVAGDVANARSGLRLAFFNVEEWALAGSAFHVQGLSAEERERTVLNVNLDSVGGGERLTAMTSGFAGIEPFLLECAESTGIALGLFRPLQTNSDHANYAAVGIPAFRLVAGFDDPQARTRLALTALDRREQVTMAELAKAADLTEVLVRRALEAPQSETRLWRT